MVDPEDDSCPIMIHVDVHRMYFQAHTKPGTYVGFAGGGSDREKSECVDI